MEVSKCEGRRASISSQVLVEAPHPRVSATWAAVLQKYRLRNDIIDPEKPTARIVKGFAQYNCHLKATMSCSYSKCRCGNTGDGYA
jgi:hypothetical protein